MDERQLENLAVSLKTPSFVFDTDILKARAAHVAEKVKPAKLCFAIKANPFLLQAMDEEESVMKCALLENFISA